MSEIRWWMFGVFWLLNGCLSTRTVDPTDDHSEEDSGTEESSVDPDRLPMGTDPCRDPTPAEVRNVIDGDTAWVMSGWGEELVRFIGIDTPEVDHKGDGDECYGEEASDKLENILEDESLWLTFDGECEDDYGRTLAYVHIGQGSDDFVQRVLLEGGYATAFAVEPNTTFAKAFAADEAQAASAGVGLWSDCR